MTNRIDPDESDRLDDYVVMYHDQDDSDFDSPLAFDCQAEDSDHAEEQCIDAYDDCSIVHIYQGSDIQDSYADWTDRFIPHFWSQ